MNIRAEPGDYFAKHDTNFLKIQWGFEPL